MTRCIFSVFLLLSSVVACGDDGSVPDTAADSGVDGSPDGSTDAGEMCVVDRDCDNGTFCDGAERCDALAEGADARGCAPPLRDNPCASDERCDEGARGCLPLCEINPDFDGDGEDSIECGGTDCDDDDVRRGRMNPELCDADGLDEDCDTDTLGPDLDGDSFVSTMCCNQQASGTLRCGVDCNDDDTDVNPREFETCNSVDDNCNGEVDEGLDEMFFPDCDRDLHGAVGSTPVIACAAPEAPPEVCPSGDWVLNDDRDCDDSEPTVNPSATETCDGLDNDCNGVLDGPDADRDDDGVRDCMDGCVANPNATSPGVCGCSEPEDDLDGDGVPRCSDSCPRDPDKSAPGVCGCGREDTGAPDCASPTTEIQELRPPFRGIDRAFLMDLGNDGRLEIITPYRSRIDLGVWSADADGTFSVTEYDTDAAVISVSPGHFNSDTLVDLVVVADVTTFGSGPDQATVFLGNPDGTLMPGVDSPFDGRASTIAVGDIDEDGIDDVVASNLGNEVFVLYGDGDGRFTETATVITAPGAERSALVDLNGDGHLDLVMMGRGAGETFWSAGDGDGGWGAKVVVDMGGSVSEFVAADLNDDGWLDLVAGNSRVAEYDLGIRLGGPAGVLGPLVTLDQEWREVESLTATDADGDGIVDLVVLADEDGVALLRGRGDGSFASAEIIAPRSGSAMAVGDLTADGTPDFVVGRRIYQSWLNNPMGPLMSRRVDSDPEEGLVVADFDGDGLVDMLSTNFDLVFRAGIGDGSFASGTTMSVPGGASTFAVTDFEGDGTLDLFAYSFRELRALRGAGDGSFEPIGTPVAMTGSNADEILAADLNGDSEVDAVVRIGSRVFFVAGSGGGTFLAPVQLFDDVTSSVIATGDFDGNGVPDLAIGSRVRPVVEIALNDGSATWTRVAYDVPAPAEGLSVADLNLDGHTDVAVASGSQVTVLRGDGMGSFSVGTILNDRRNEGLRLADVDGDGLLDILGIHESTGEILIDHGSPGFVFGPTVRLANIDDASSVAVADINGDGASDIITVNREDNDSGGPFVRWTTRMGRTRAFTPAGTVATAAGSRALTAGDFDGDGHDDLAVACIGGNSIDVLLWDGNNFAISSSLPAGSRPTSVIARDFDGDGHLDLAASEELSATVGVWLSDGAGSFGARRSVPAPMLPQSVVDGDWNEDGVTDLFVASGGSTSTALLMGAGDGSFTLASVVTLPHSADDASVCDFDADGHADIVAVSATDDSLVVLSGDGVGGLTTGEAIDVGTSPRSVLCADLDGDGVLDLVTANEGSDDVTLLWGLGEGLMDESRTWPVGRAPQSVLVVDADGDGTMDLLVTNQSDNSVSLLRGQASRTFVTSLGVAWTGTAPQDLVAMDADGNGRMDLFVASEAEGGVDVVRGVGALPPTR